MRHKHGRLCTVKQGVCACGIGTWVLPRRAWSCLPRSSEVVVWRFPSPTRPEGAGWSCVVRGSRTNPGAGVVLTLRTDGEWMPRKIDHLPYTHESESKFLRRDRHGHAFRYQPSSWKVRLLGTGVLIVGALFLGGCLAATTDPLPDHRPGPVQMSIFAVLFVLCAYFAVFGVGVLRKSTIVPTAEVFRQVTQIRT